MTRLVTAEDFCSFGRKLLVMVTALCFPDRLVQNLLSTICGFLLDLQKVPPCFCILNLDRRVVCERIRALGFVNVVASDLYRRTRPSYPRIAYPSRIDAPSPPFCHSARLHVPAYVFGDASPVPSLRTQIRVFGNCPLSGMTLRAPC